MHGLTDFWKQFYMIQQGLSQQYLRVVFGGSGLISKGLGKTNVGRLSQPAQTWAGLVSKV